LVFEFQNCFGNNWLFWFREIFAKLNKNINKTEITKIETINNQIYRLKSGSIKNNCYFCVKLTRSVIFGPIWTQFRSKQLKIRPGSHFCGRIDSIIDSIKSARSNRRDQIDAIKSKRSNQINRIKSIESNRSNQIDRIKSIKSKMASWPNFKLLGPKLSPNWTKNGKNWKVLSVEYDKIVHFSIFGGQNIFAKIIKFSEG